MPFFQVDKTGVKEADSFHIYVYGMLCWNRNSLHIFNFEATIADIGEGENLQWSNWANGSIL